MAIPSGTINFEVKSNGLILLHTSGNATRIVASSNYFTPYYDSHTKFYCILNNGCRYFFRKNRKVFMKYSPNFDEVEKLIDTYEEYATPKEIVYDIEPLKGITLRDYQIDSVTYMLKYKRFCLFMGTGTGKTIMALSYLNTLDQHETSGTHAIIMPKSVLGQYIDEAKKYLSDNFRIITKAEDFDIPEDDKHNLLITNYHQIKKIQVPRIDTVIFDEAHNLKDFSSSLNTYARNLSNFADHMYMFTGTPQDAMKHELFAQFYVLTPHVVVNKTLFLNRYAILDDYYKPIRFHRHLIRELDEIITKLTYGETPDNLLELTKQENHLYRVRFDDKEVYDSFSRDYIVEVDGHIIKAESPAAKRIKQRQICNGFAYDENDYPVELENPKRVALEQIVNDLEHGIIFTEFSYDIVLIQRTLVALGKDFGTVDGRSTDTATTIKEFKDNKFPFLIMQSRAGSSGLDLSVTNNVIFYSLPESGLVFRQAKARIRRMGQEKTCHYYYILVKGTIETKIVRGLAIKNERHLQQFDLYRRKP